MEKIKKTNGITLIALIITIIVMLILVGVSIQVLINSNLIGTAQNAEQKTEKAYEDENSLGDDVMVEYKEIVQNGLSSKVIAKDTAINTNLNKASVKEVVQTKTVSRTYEA